MTPFSIITAAIALIVLNVPVSVLLGRLPFITDLTQALKEKSPIGGSDDTTSYSRVTGLVGAVIMTSFFWAMANIIIFKAFTAIADIKPLISSVQIFFLVGAAMFLPYAFNQIRSAFAAGPTAAAAIAWISSIGNLGGFFGPWYVGFIKDETGSYAGGLYGLAALALVAAVVCAFFLKIPNNAALEDEPAGH